MPFERVLSITAFGKVDQDVLDRLRDELGFKRKGRLTDIEDEEFGHREERLDGTTVWLSLWRYSAESWSLVVSSEGEALPDEAIEAYGAKFRAALRNTGLVVNREWRR